MKKQNEYIFDDTRKNRGLTSVSKTILPFVKSVLGKKGFIEVDIISSWQDIVGQDLAEYSAPQKIDFKKGEKSNGTLNIFVPSGAFALEIKHKERIILEKVNAYFGYGAVGMIKVVQNSEVFELREDTSELSQKSLVTAEEETYIKDLSGGVDSTPLREALFRLGKSVFNNSHKQEE